MTEETETQDLHQTNHHITLFEYMDERQILNLYWPVIEQARNVAAFYTGKDDGVMKICPDVVGPLIEELNKAQKECFIVREQK